MGNDFKVSVWGGECSQTNTVMEILLGSQLSKEEERKSEKGIAGKRRERKREKSKREKEGERECFILFNQSSFET